MSRKNLIRATLLCLLLIAVGLILLLIGFLQEGFLIMKIGAVFFILVALTVPIQGIRTKRIGTYAGGKNYGFKGKEAVVYSIFSLLCGLYILYKVVTSLIPY